MTGGEDERVMLQALDDSLVIRCDTPSCPNDADFGTVVHGRVQGGTNIKRHLTAFRCHTCISQMHARMKASLERTGAIRCPICNGLFRTINSWWEVNKLHD